MTYEKNKPKRKAELQIQSIILMSNMSASFFEVERPKTKITDIWLTKNNKIAVGDVQPETEDECSLI